MLSREPYYADDSVTLYHSKAEQVLPTLAPGSIDAVVTDPPYELGFMGRAWDASGIAYSVELWREALRVLKPGGHLLAFGGTRTVHRLTCAIEDAGFEIRDGIDWIYGSGFPKSLDVSKAIDNRRNDRPGVLRVTAWLAEARDAAGWTNRQIDALWGFNGMAGLWTTQGKAAIVPTIEQWARLRECLGFGDEMDAEVRRLNSRKRTPGHERPDRVVTEPTSGVVYQPIQNVVATGSPVLDDARRWQGWGTALKPAREPIVVARKPLQGTVAANVLRYGTGALNVDACRIDGRERTDYGLATATRSRGATFGEPSPSADFDSSKGRWPTNVVLSHAGNDEVGDLCADECVSGCPVAELDQQSSTSASRIGGPRGGQQGDGWRMKATGAEYDDSGGASRFFPVFRYEAKADSAERPRVNGVAHPTVKPLALMRWLVRLVTPPGGTVADFFAGSGTTGEACLIEGFGCILAEREADYLPLIVTRLSKSLQPVLFGELAS